MKQTIMDKIRNWSTKKKVIVGAVMLFVLLGCFGVFNDSGDVDEPEPEITEAAETVSIADEYQGEYTLEKITIADSSETIAMGDYSPAELDEMIGYSFFKDSTVSVTSTGAIAQFQDVNIPLQAVTANGFKTVRADDISLGGGCNHEGYVELMFDTDDLHLELYYYN